MLRNKCAKVVLRAQWFVTVEGSWEKVGDSSLVQCKTRFVQIFHIFFFMKPLILYPDLTLSYAVGDLGTRLPLLLLTPYLNCLFMSFVLSQWKLLCSCLKPLVLSNVVQGGNFSPSIQDYQFPEESGVDGQNDVIDRVSDPHHIFHLPSPPSKFWTLQTEITFVWLRILCVDWKNKTEVKHGFISESVVWRGLFF